ncbi:MAG: 6-carboxytetrahydropterin synthase QueD [Patescibacteria group bacterium]
MANMDLNCTFKFAASHFLPNYNGQCENLHGHNYKIIITVSGEVKKDGLVVDFKEIKRIVNEQAINNLDHKHLNDIIENPSSENIAIWIWNQVKNNLLLKKIAVFETEDCYVEYYG